jgi:hypothetical protein
MNISQDYIKLFDVNIKEIKSFVQTLTDEDWNFWDYRQKTYKVHSRTKSYPLIWTDSSNNVNVIETDKFDIIWDILSPTIARLEQYYNGRYVNIMFAKLISGEKIDAHIDVKEILRNVHRCHLPIQTNSNVVFSINKTHYFLEEGYFYEINNCVEHGVDNNSDEDRVHLIIDILPDSSKMKVNFLYW